MEDSLVWNLDRRIGFSVSSLTSAAVDVKGQEVGVDSLAVRVWRNFAPPKVEFMVLLALLGKLHTKNLLYLHKRCSAFSAGGRSKQLTTFWVLVILLGDYGVRRAKVGVFNSFFLIRWGPCLNYGWIYIRIWGTFMKKV